MLPRTLHDMVRKAAAKHGGRTAVVFDSGASAQSRLTYEQLKAFGNELSEQLMKAVGDRESNIALYCHTDVLLPVWITGILQLPAAYIPLEPESPATFNLRIMEKCHLRFCLVQSSLLQQFQSTFSSLLSIELCTTWSVHKLTLVKIHKKLLTSTQASVVDVTLRTGKQAKEDNLILHEEQEAVQCSSSDVPRKIHQGEQLAYVLHTSGTTGLAKIVKVPHKCIVPNIIHLRSLFQMTPDDVVFLASPLTFDPSVVEMFLALSSGACLLIVPSAVKKMPGRLAHVLFRRNKTTVLQATPTLVRRFGVRVLKEEVLSAGSSLRVLALGGEACPSWVILKSWRQEGNKTGIYNLYGTTEVSCWACYYELPNDLLSSDNMADVPLGYPLMDTTVEVRDERGCLVTEGEGHVFIGGQDRVCLLDNETVATSRTMRATGDWVMVRNAHLYYMGRKDRLVKRHGQRVHLDALQQAAETLPLVESCAVGLHEESRLVAFVVPTTASSSEYVLSSTDTSAVVHKEVSENTSYSSKSIERDVLNALSKVLPSHSIPDAVLLVPALPLTNHGKVDMVTLMKMYERQRKDKEVNGKLSGWEDMETARETLQTIWKECLGLSDDVVVTEDAHFMLSGGDSLQALRLFDYITITMGTTSVGLLEVILDGSFLDVLKHVTTMASHNLTLTTVKRQREDSTSVIPTKRRHAEGTSSVVSERITGGGVSSVRGTMGFVVVRRAGEVLKWVYTENGEESFQDSAKDNTDWTQIPANERFLKDNFSPLSVHKPSEGAKNNSDVKPIDLHLPKQADVTHINKDAPHGVKKGHHVSQQSGDSLRSDTKALGLEVLWSSDTGKCVDASPVLLVGPDRTTVFIGSHSHRLQALDLSSGEVIWERVLGDRLESSAAISKCGTLVAVGSYDGQVYFLRVDSGETWWTFKTGDAVKSSPSVDPHTGLLAVGSHDGHVYALEPLAKRCVWKHYCGGGSVFSSPYVHSSPRRLYSATLRGQLHCLTPDSGEMLWIYSSDVPFFSSPSCSDSCVCIGTVKGQIRALDHNGHVLWDIRTDGPVFSSPCTALISRPTIQRITSREDDSVTPISLANQVVVCGSHDGSVYCLNIADGSMLWQFQTTGKVYSSPFVFDGTPWGLRTLVVVASTDGTVWVLDGELGTLKASLSLPGELFSSPVVWGHSIVVGCRNDYVYCLELTGSTEQQSAIH